MSGRKRPPKRDWQNCPSRKNRRWEAHSEPRKTGRPPGMKDYEVGYGRPPQGTRFKPGQSGNPKGRPRGTRNFVTDLHDALHERILMREGDKTKRISKQEGAIASLIAKSLKGDARCLGLLLQQIERHFLERSSEPVREELSPYEAEILQRLCELNGLPHPQGVVSKSGAGRKPPPGKGGEPRPEVAANRRKRPRLPKWFLYKEKKNKRRGHDHQSLS